jgi:hypothetical protein
MRDAMGDETGRQRALDVRAALDDYAATYREVIRIAADGGSEDEIADLATGAFAAAIAIPHDAADDAPGQLLRELSESLLVLSGVQRIADTLSLPVATCANGKSLRPLLDPRGELAEWYHGATGSALEPVAIPGSLVRADVRDSSPTAILRWPRRRLAANVDRGADRTTRPTDLNRIFATRLAEALAALGDPDAATVARRFAPVLIGFSRLADRRQAGLRPPDGATALARLVVERLVAAAAGDPRGHTAPTRASIDAAAAPLGDWLAPG